MEGGRLDPVDQNAHQSQNAAEDSDGDDAVEHIMRHVGDELRSEYDLPAFGEQAFERDEDHAEDDQPQNGP